MPATSIRSSLVVLAAVLLAAPGCARKSPLPSAANGAAGKASSQAETPPTYVAWVPTPNGPAYRGKDAGQWAERIQSRDQPTLHEATQALGKLGAEGLPHLVRGMQSSQWETRLSSMQAIDRDVLMTNEQQVAATLARLLADEQPAIRRQAVVRLGWLSGDKIKPALPALRRLAETDPDPETRRSALDTIVAASNNSVQQLVGLLSEANADVRLQAIARLKDMAAQARAAAPRLRQIAESDPHPGVRQAASNALGVVR